MTERVVTSKRSVPMGAVLSFVGDRWWPINRHMSEMWREFPWPDNMQITVEFRAVVDGDDPAYATFFEAIEQRSND